MVGKREESFDRSMKLTSAGVGAADHSRSGLEKVRPADRADEDEVAGEDPHCLVGPATFVRKNEREMLRSVAWGVERRELHLADAELVAVLQQLRMVIPDIAVLP